MNFKEIEGLFANFFGAASRDLTNEEQAEIREYADVGEYGLALETAVDIYIEEGKAPSAEAFSLIQRLASCMSIDGEVISMRLQASKQRKNG